MKLNELHEKYESVARARAEGCKSETVAGLVRWLAKHPRPVNSNHKLRNIPSKEPANWRVFGIDDPGLRWDAMEASATRHKRISNWEMAHPTVKQFAEGYYYTINHGRYSSGCSYERYSHTPVYYSRVEIAHNSLSVIYANKGGRWIQRVPTGCYFRKDSLGLVVIRKTDGMDYHPDVDDLMASDFRGRVRRAMAINYGTRVIIRKRERFEARHEAIFLREGATQVRLQDARRAGLCVQGVRSFLNRARVDTDRLTKPLFFLPGKLVERLGKRFSDHRANLAIRAAWERETTISI